MKIKKIRGTSLKEATEKVRQQFGREAIILGTRIIESDLNNRKLFEITVGLETELEELESIEENKNFGENIYNDFKKAVETAKRSKALNKDVVVTIEPPEDMPRLKLTDMPEKVTRQDLKEVINILKYNELDANVIKIVMDQLHKSKELITKKNLEKHTLVSIASLVNTTKLNVRKTGSPKIVAIVGPTGVGKTTCIAKLASITKLLHGLEVGIISIDTYRLGAIDQLKIFSEISNIDLLVAYDVKDIPDIMEKFKNKDLIFVDTVGRSQKNKNELNSIKKFMDVIEPSEIYLALSAVSSRKNLMDVAEKFKIFNYKALIFTKLDEAIAFGNILNISLSAASPIVYLTNGQVIPDDIIASDSEFIAKIIFTGRIN